MSQQIKRSRYSLRGKISYVHQLAKAPKLTGEDFRVALYLIMKLSGKSYRSVAQKEVASYLDMSQPNVSRAVARLRRKKLLSKQTNPDDTRRAQYKLRIS